MLSGVPELFGLFFHVVLEIVPLVLFRLQLFLNITELDLEVFDCLVFLLEFGLQLLDPLDVVV